MRYVVFALVLAAFFLAGCSPTFALAKEVRFEASGHFAGTTLSPAATIAAVDRTLGAQAIPMPNYQAEPNTPSADRSLAPYFRGASDGSVESLPLKETSADIEIAGVIAAVKVRQIYENTGREPIAATYVFPASTRAAVHAMRMRIGERVIEAKIDKRAQARADYESAREQGKRAALLEQERPNVFSMSVANIMPGDRIEVELEYSELLLPENAVYELVYPTVVGPRFAGGVDAERERWIANPYLREGEAAPYRFALRVRLRTGIPIKELSSPSHAVEVSYASDSDAEVSLTAPGGGNRDFVLRYRLAGERVETGVLVGEAQGERFFLLLAEPPARPTRAQIPPREYVFVLDVSGSMHGFPLDTARTLIDKLLDGLRPSDLFNVVLFAGAAAVLSPTGSLPAQPGNIETARSLIQRQSGGGGTQLMQGLESAYAIPKPEGFSRSIVLITDGYVGVEAQAFKLVRERLGEANLFAFGIGTAVNRWLIESVARAGRGEPFVVLSANAAAAQAEKFRRYIESPVLTGIRIDYTGIAATDIAPEKVPDLMAERAIVVIGKLDSDSRGEIRVRGRTGQGAYEQTLEVASAASQHAPLRFLWARTWVSALEDQLALAPAQSDLEAAITQLGLSYSLLTRFTSFVAIDSERANATQQLVSVSQPLPLPQGVSNLAVAGLTQLAAPAPSYTPPPPSFGPSYSGAPPRARPRSSAMGESAGRSKAYTSDDLFDDSPRPGRRDATRATLSKDDVLAGARKNMDSLNLCLTAAIRAGELLPGRRYILVLDWNIEPNGSVTGGKLNGPPELLGSTLPACFAAKMRQWRFPMSERRTPIRNFPLPFSAP